jgi:RNA polymerase sigma-70 factor (ECF subfamily)
MGDPPSTRASLLLRLRQAEDREAWRQFVQLYAPLVYRFGRRKGLQDADAADLTQEVLRSVMGSVGRLEYDPSRGLFRSWLFTLAHRRLADFLGRGGREAPLDTETLTEQRSAVDAGRDDEETWNLEYRRRVFAQAMERVRPQVSQQTWQAFWQTAVEGRGGAEVATGLGMSVAAVYLAKSRVMAQLKNVVKDWEG